MIWEECIKRNLVERKSVDKELAKSLLEIATRRFNFFLKREISVFVLEGVYEAIIELGHAFLALEGMKTTSHECVIEFLRNKYLTQYESDFLHKMRKKRHGIKYYGKILSYENIKKQVNTGKRIFLKLKRRLETVLSSIK